VASVKKTVSGLDGVDKAEVDYPSKTVTITMKEDKSLTKEVLDKAFDGGKFSVTKFETVGEVKEEKKEEKKEEPPKKEDPPKEEKKEGK